MLSSNERYILFLLRKSFGLRAESIRPEDEKLVSRMILDGGILLTVYDSLSDGLKEALYMRYYAALRLAVLQEHEGCQILRALGASGMPCIGLKGWEMRSRYPAPNMRQMADLDILVCPYNFAKISALMKQLGYEGQAESTWKHDNFQKGKVTVEVHKRLTDDSGEIHRWEKSLWERAVPSGDVQGVFRMSPEDEYVFHFVHMYKDFCNGSLGLRRIVDTWLMSSVPVGSAAVEASLAAMGLTRFHQRMVWLSRVTMGEEPMNEEAELLLHHAFSHGVYGTEKSYKAGRITAMSSGSLHSGKWRSRLAAVFLPLPRMKAQYPELEKYPFLLPWCWLKRVAHALHGDIRKTVSMMDYSNVDEADYEEMRRFFEAGGIERK